MYPKEYFKERFAELSTDELLLKLSGGVADNAHDAIVELLAIRGITSGQLAARARESKKADIRSSKGTIECDYCGNSARKNPVLDQGQRFCSSKCLRSARISEAAVDITDAHVLAHAQAIRSGVCPGCQSSGGIVEVRFYHRVVSAIFFTRYDRKRRLCCYACGRRENIVAFCLTFLGGWWGIPFGIILTPTYLIANIGELWENRHAGEASDELLRVALLQLAEARLQGQQSAPGG